MEQRGWRSAELFEAQVGDASSSPKKRAAIGTSRIPPIPVGQVRPEIRPDGESQARPGLAERADLSGFERQLRIHLIVKQHESHVHPRVHGQVHEVEAVVRAQPEMTEEEGWRGREQALASGLKVGARRDVHERSELPAEEVQA